jgi:hypothetical protein
LEKVSDAQWEQIKNATDELCGTVFKTADSVLRNVDLLGFSKLLEQPKPNAEDALARVKLFDGVFTALIDFFQRMDKPEQISLLINTKQQILHLEGLINAVRAGHFEEASDYVKRLKTQKF